MENNDLSERIIVPELQSLVTDEGEGRFDDVLTLTPDIEPKTTPQLENGELATPIDDEHSSWLKRIYRKNRFKIAIGAAALSLGVTLATNPATQLANEVKHDAPYVGVGMAVGEAMWIGGALLMGAAVGSKIRNPFKIKSQMKDIAEQANSSTMFKTGFWINTIGAVGEFVVPAVAVATHFPVESWGVLTPSLFDLGVTLYVRKAILDGVHRAGQEPN